MKTEITKENLVKYGFTDHATGANDNSWFPDYMTKDLISEKWRKEHAVFRL